MKPLTTDQPRVQGQQSQQPQQSGAYTWAFDEEQQRLLLDINNKDISTSSTSSNSPPFSMGSASSPLELSGGNRPLTTAPYGSHIVGAHRRQHSTARHSSTDSLFRQPGHPYALPPSLSTGTLHPHLARRRRLPTHMDAMTEEQHLENLWSMHGVTGSAHLGAGLTDQLASTSLHSDEWLPSGLQTPTIDEVLDPAYYGAAVNPDRFTTVDPSLRQTYEVHNPFTEDLFRHLGEDDLAHSHDADMDLVDDHLDLQHDESPLSEEHEPKSIGRSNSSDSGVTARRPATKAQAQIDDDKEHAGSDHEHNDDDKAHPSKPSNNFVNKLHLMISDPKAADFIWWTELGTSFVVSSAGEFSRSILGQHFKHNNFSSFVRQLNMYGFHKINRTPRNQRVQPDAQQWEFSHPKFLRGRQDLLEDIKRKPVEPDPSSARQRVELPSEVAAKLREMAVAHTEVVKTLQVERNKVSQLTAIVKVLYDRLALSGPLPPFPLDLLESRPPLRTSIKSVGMDLTGNSLIPSAASTSARVTRSRPNAARTTRRGRSEEQSDHAETNDQHPADLSGAAILNGRVKSESNIFAR